MYKGHVGALGTAHVLSSDGCFCVGVFHLGGKIIEQLCT